MKENWYIDFIFLREDVAVHINIMLWRLLVQIPISFPAFLCNNLIDMRVNLGVLFVLILSYLVSERRELYLSEHKLENLIFFTCLIYYLAETRKFSRQGEAFWNSSTAHERKAAPGKMSEFFLRDTLKTILNEKFNPQMKTIRPFSPRKLGQLFLIFKKRPWRPLVVVRLYWADENTKKK